MPNISEMKQSKFLTKGDVGNGILLTITGCIQENVAMPGAGDEYKWCLTFEEVEKPLVLNSINAQLCSQILKSPETDDWVGGKIVAYTDPTISYAGRVIGGIRIRAPKNQPATATKPTQQKAAPPARRPAPAPVDPGPDPSAEDPDNMPF